MKVNAIRTKTLNFKGFNKRKASKNPINSPGGLLATTAVGLAVAGGFLYKGKILPQLIKKEGEKILKDASLVLQESKKALKKTQKELEKAQELVELSQKKFYNDLRCEDFEFFLTNKSKIVVEADIVTDSVRVIKEFNKDKLIREIYVNKNELNVVNHINDNFSNVYHKDDWADMIYASFNVDNKTLNAKHYKHEKAYQSSSDLSDIGCQINKNGKTKEYFFSNDNKIESYVESIKNKGKKLFHFNKNSYNVEFQDKNGFMTENYTIKQ